MSTARGVLVVVAAALAVGLAPSGAQADPAAGLRMSIDAGKPLAPTVTLTNETGHACQMVPNALGTIGVTSIVAGGKPVTPIGTEPEFPDGLDVVLAQQLVTLAPGASKTFPLAVVAAGPTGHAIETATWALSGAFGAIYPITSAGWQAGATYGVPVTPKAGAPLCPTATTDVAAAPLTHHTAWVRWAVIAAAILIVLGLVLLLLLIRRRGRRGSTTVAAATALIVLVALAAVIAPPATPANARIIPEDSALNAKLLQCEQAFGGANGLTPNDPAHILSWINDPSTTILLGWALPGDDHEFVSNGEIHVQWDPYDHHAFAMGGSSEMCGALYHELFHAYASAHGGNDPFDCIADGHDTLIPVREVLATRWENIFRENEGLPDRKDYDGAPMPDGPCIVNGQPAASICRDLSKKPIDDAPLAVTDTTATLREDDGDGADCADTNGDPHITTFDGLRYAFQGAGEFVATRDATDPGFQVQTRQQAFPGSRYVAVNTAIAMDVAGDRVEVDLAAGAMRLLVNGTAAPLSGATLPHQGTITYDATAVRPSLTVTWPDGSATQISIIGPWGLHLTIRAAAARAGHLSGLFGNFDGTPDNDMRTPAGTALPATPTFAQLYPAYADAWRITDATSLFTYPPGQDTATYTDRSFPHGPPATLVSTAVAASYCASLGITDPATLADCTLDVAETGQAAFGQAARDTQTALGTAAAAPAPSPSAGPTTSSGIGTSREATLSVTAANGTDQITFAGTAGQRLLVSVLSTTVSAGCAQLALIAPTGSELNIGCATAGGSIDDRLLPTTGTYALRFTPESGHTGTVRIQLTFSTDITGTLPAGGSPVTAVIATPGQVASYAFTGTAGQRVFVEADDATLPGSCGTLSLLYPDGGTDALGCLSGTSGYIDGTLLSVSGRYAVQVDPADQATGQVTLRLVASQDVHASTTIGGTPVPVTITAPGQRGFVTFAGTTGQRVSLAGTGSTFPAECGLPDLLAPNGGAIGLGCSNADGTASLAAVTLPSTGTYTVEIDPDGRTTGTITLSVHSP